MAPMVRSIRLTLYSPKKRLRQWSTLKQNLLRRPRTVEYSQLSQCRPGKMPLMSASHLAFAVVPVGVGKELMQYSLL